MQPHQGRRLLAIKLLIVKAFTAPSDGFLENFHQQFKTGPLT
jgi:hypothetical protein